MRENINRDKADLDQYGFRPFKDQSKRLDLNDLLQRVKNQKKNDKKFNLIVFCGAATVAAILYLLLSF